METEPNELDMVKLAEDSFIKKEKEGQTPLDSGTETIMRYSYNAGARFWLQRGLEMGEGVQKRKMLEALGLLKPTVEG